MGSYSNLLPIVSMNTLALILLFVSSGTGLHISEKTSGGNIENSGLANVILTVYEDEACDFFAESKTLMLDENWNEELQCLQKDKISFKFTLDATGISYTEYADGSCEGASAKSLGPFELESCIPFDGSYITLEKGSDAPVNLEDEEPASKPGQEPEPDENAAEVESEDGFPDTV